MSFKEKTKVFLLGGACVGLGIVIDADETFTPSVLRGMIAMGSILMVAAFFFKYDLQNPNILQIKESSCPQCAQGQMASRPLMELYKKKFESESQFRCYCIFIRNKETWLEQWRVHCTSCDYDNDIPGYRNDTSSCNIEPDALTLESVERPALLSHSTYCSGLPQSLRQRDRISCCDRVAVSCTAFIGTPLALVGLYLFGGLDDMFFLLLFVIALACPVIAIVSCFRRYHGFIKLVAEKETHCPNCDLRREMYICTHKIHPASFGGTKHPDMPNVEIHKEQYMIHCSSCNYEEGLLDHVCRVNESEQSLENELSELVELAAKADSTGIVTRYKCPRGWKRSGGGKDIFEEIKKFSKTENNLKNVGSYTHRSRGEVVTRSPGGGTHQYAVVAQSALSPSSSIQMTNMREVV